MTSSKQKRIAEVGWFCLFAFSTIGYSLVQDVIRPEYSGNSQAVIYVLGMLPNFLAAIAVPAILMILIPYVRKGDQASKWFRSSKSLHLPSIIISATGLLTWEFLQIYMPNGFFDWHDVLWTCIGLCTFYFIWIIVDKLS